MKELDARGLACPQPVILTRRLMKGGEGEILVRVDNAVAVENLKRLADSQGYAAAVEGREGDYTLTLRSRGEPSPSSWPGGKRGEGVDGEASPSGPTPWAVFVGRDIIGAGDRELGRNLMRMYFYTLAQGESLPAAVLFMNDGVKLPVLDEQIREHLQTLGGRGVRILVCGTCLSFYGLAEKLTVGTVSNMYDMVEEMGRQSKVISL